MVPFEILVVCLGNVCRSPLAERVLRLRFDKLLGDAAGSVHVGSAGVSALSGSSMDENVAAELRRLGGDPDGFVSTQLDGRLTDGADLVLSATRQLRSRVLEESPRALKRTFTLREFAALATSQTFRECHVTSIADLVGRVASWRGSVPVDEYDVPDPIGQSAAFHHEVAEMLDEQCTLVARAVVDAILSDVGQS